MSQSTIRRHCGFCNQPRPFVKQTPAHLTHFILTLFTCGAWLVVWIPIVLMGVFRPYRCEFCGKAKH